MFSRRIIILDCGASHTALGIFSRQNDRLNLEQYALENFAPPAGSPGKWLENTAAAFLALRSGLKNGGPAGLVLPAHLLLNKQIKLPRMDAGRRAKIIRFEAAQHIPTDLSEVVWDSAVVGEDEQHTEELLVAAKRGVVESLCAVAEVAGFEPGLALPSPLATLAGFRLILPTRIESSLVLNLGARSGTLLQVGAKRFGVRTFPLATQALEAPSDATAAAARIFRIGQEVARYLALYSREDAPMRPTRIFLTGGGTRVPGLREALVDQFKMDVEYLNILEAIDHVDPKLNNGMTGDRLLDLIGAAATQLCPDQPSLNLLPAGRRQQNDLVRRQPWLIASVMLVALAFIPPLVHFHRLADEARQKTAAIERELVPLRSLAARDHEALQRIEQLRQRVGLLQNIQDHRTGWLGLLRDWEVRLARVEDVWLDRLQISPGAPGTPWRINVSGRMLDRVGPVTRSGQESFGRVKALLASLGESPFVSAVESERFDNSQPGILRFDLVLVANPQRPL